MNNDIKAKAKKIIKDNLYMTISVCSRDGKPWIANLYYTYDKDYTFYWYSPKDSVHSELIRENPEIAIAIFDSQAVGNDIDAVYIKAKAFEIESRIELLKGLRCYAKKLLTKKTNITRFVKQYKDFQRLSPLRMYKAVPEKFYKLAPSEMYNEKFIDSRLDVDIR